VGKTECWLVISCESGSGVYLGLKDGYTFESLKRTIETAKDASSCLNFIEVNPGDFISVPSGTIHAIGAGVNRFFEDHSQTHLFVAPPKDQTNHTH
jgi:mannose-6-phosphate isomerase